MKKENDINNALRKTYEFKIPDINIPSYKYGELIEEFASTFNNSFYYDKYICNNYIKFNTEIFNEINKKHLNDRSYILGVISGIYLSTDISNQYPSNSHEKYMPKDVFSMVNYDLHSYLNDIKKMYKISRYYENNEEKYYARYYVDNYDLVTDSVSFSNEFQLGVLSGIFYNITELMEIEKLKINDLNHFQELDHVFEHLENEEKKKVLQM